MDPYARSARYRTIPKEIYLDRADDRTLLGVQIEGAAVRTWLQQRDKSTGLWWNLCRSAEYNSYPSAAADRSRRGTMPQQRMRG